VAGGIERLTALKVARLIKPGRYGDGKGLNLQITKTGAKSWVFRYERGGRERLMGLGPLHTVSLADAREKARVLRAQLLQGVDPLEQRHADVVAMRAEQASNLDFDTCAAKYIASREPEWKNGKHRDQWESTLRVYVSPHFGSIYVRRINTAMVLKALEPIWKSRTETATRVRERIERVLSWATTRGYREGENPARWSGHLEELLPNPAKLKKVKHHPALPFDEAGAFFAGLKEQEGLGARALEFTILTACRTSEVLGAKWSEVDLANRTWTVPPERMKAGKPHRVPLVEATEKLLKGQAGQDPIFVFPGAREGKPLSTMAMLMILRRMQRKDLTVHGFRSTFRDWVAEKTDYPSEMAEIALAHTVGTAVENAYRRTDLFERRRSLMKDWAVWCGKRPDSTTDVAATGDAQ
jgi:integrase